MPPLGSDDDPRLDFYMMYKREATEYDTTYVKKYDEDLNTTLIFVCGYHYSFDGLSDVLISGWSVLRGQLCFRHRRTTKIAARYR